MLFMDVIRRKILPFPADSDIPARPEIIVQIGDERFAIRWEIEELPTTAPVPTFRKEPKSAGKTRETIQLGSQRKGVSSG